MERGGKREMNGAGDKMEMNGAGEKKEMNGAGKIHHVALCTVRMILFVLVQM